MKKPKGMDEAHPESCDCEKCMPKMKEGGEVEDKAIPEAPEGEDDIHEMVGPEMMDAIHTKDHKKMMQGLEAMVLHCINKKGE